MKGGKERAPRGRGAVVILVLLPTLFLLWQRIWSSGTASGPALQSLCDTAATAAWPPGAVPPKGGALALRPALLSA